jgi:hypothetical protein
VETVKKGPGKLKNGADRCNGRPKGLPNKFTRNVKKLLIDTLDDLGGRDFVLKWARENPTEFMKLLGKLIPLQVNAAVTTSGIDVSFPDAQKVSVIDTEFSEVTENAGLYPTILENEP